MFVTLFPILPANKVNLNLTADKIKTGMLQYGFYSVITQQGLVDVYSPFIKTFL